MAFSLNRSQLIGNVTRDPEVRVAGTQKVTTIGIATNRSWMDKASGQKKEKTDFHNVVLWGRLAEIAEQYIRKGQKLYVEGRMETRDWEGEDGVKRYKTEIVAENLIMLGKKGETSESPMHGAEPVYSQERAQKSVKAKSPAATEQVKEEEVVIDDLPF
jgi:single-strand DNA-binding protein